MYCVGEIHRTIKLRLFLCSAIALVNADKAIHAHNLVIKFYLAIIFLDVLFRLGQKQVFLDRQKGGHLVTEDDRPLTPHPRTPTPVLGYPICCLLEHPSAVLEFVYAINNNFRLG